MLDDEDVFISPEAEIIEQIRIKYKRYRYAIIACGVVVCAIEIFLTLRIIINHLGPDDHW